jgi:hypothetical protein
MNGIIKPKIINSNLLNSEINNEFITNFSSAPIYGKYGDTEFFNSTFLRINFDNNKGQSNNILSNKNNKIIKLDNVKDSKLDLVEKEILDYINNEINNI